MGLRKLLGELIRRKTSASVVCNTADCGGSKHSSSSAPKGEEKRIQRTRNADLHICPKIDEPWDQKPIKFQDALGRRFPVPLEICQNFADFSDFLYFSFKRFEAILPYIFRRDFWLFTPSRNASPWWYLINENDWTQVACAGATLGMSLFGADHIDWLPRGAYYCGYEEYGRQGREKQNWPHVRGPEEDSYIRFSRPIPPWSTLPANLEFRWWSRPAVSGPLSMSEPTTDGRRRNVMHSFASGDPTSQHVPSWKVESRHEIARPHYSGFRVTESNIFERMEFLDRSKKGRSQRNNGGSKGGLV